MNVRFISKVMDEGLSGGRQSDYFLKKVLSSDRESAIISLGGISSSQGGSDRKFFRRSVQESANVGFWVLGKRFLKCWSDVGGSHKTKHVFVITILISFCGSVFMNICKSICYNSKFYYPCPMNKWDCVV